MTRVFTYGSLMYGEVWQRVVNSHAQPVPAIVSGYERFCVQGETYPAMVETPGVQVAGMLYSDVTDLQLKLLDEFEGPEYRRIEVSALVSASAQVRAQAYLFVGQETLILRPWDADRFERYELSAFLAKHGPD